MTQQGDVLLFQTNDDGDIIVENGLVEMSGGLKTVAYLSLFGGNEDDDGRPDNPDNWWGNIDEDDPAGEYHSETQNLLQALPAVSRNLRRVEDTAKRDLAWFVSSGVASSVEAIASIPGVNKLQLVVSITARGEESEFVFVQNWKAAT